MQPKLRLTVVTSLAITLIIVILGFWILFSGRVERLDLVARLIGYLLLISPAALFFALIPIIKFAKRFRAERKRGLEKSEKE